MGLSFDAGNQLQGNARRHQGMKDDDEALKSATATPSDKRVDPLARNLCRTRDARNGRFETRLINLLFWK